MVATDFHRLADRHPEWAPWLAMLQPVFAAFSDSRWDAAVPSRASHDDACAALIDGASVERSVVMPLLLEFASSLRRVAALSGVEPLVAWAAGSNSGSALLLDFRAAIEMDESIWARRAGECAIAGDAYAAIAALLALPWLQACRRRWSSEMPIGWQRGYCPMCAAWPAAGYVIGVDRQRLGRCTRCGAGWSIPALRCVFCDMQNHDELVQFTVEQVSTDRASSRAAIGSIEACLQCLGYLKIATVLSAPAPELAMIDDLTSAHLDWVAIERGYHRRGGLGHPVRLAVRSE